MSKKSGYSTAEVARIIGVTDVTVRKMIERGDLQCYGKYRQGAFHGRRITIGKRHLAEYILSHRERFDATTIEEYTKGVKNLDEPHPHTGNLDVYTDLYGAHYSTTSDPVEEHSDPAEESSIIRNPESHAGFILSFNDRIAVVNITAETAVTIITALLKDPLIKITDIKISRKY